MGIVSTASTTNGPRGTQSSPSSTRPTPTAHRTPPISYTTASTSNPPLFTVVQGLDTFAGAGGVDSSRLLDQLRRRATEGSGVGRQWAKARLWAIGVVESKVHVLGWIDSSTCVACALSLSSPSLLPVSGASSRPPPSRPVPQSPSPSPTTYTACYSVHAAHPFLRHASSHRRFSSPAGIALVLDAVT